MKKWIFILALVIFAFGCIKPVQQIGCCLRENATSETNPGCVLYNTTTYQEMPQYFDKTDSCNATAGNCNVSFTIPNGTSDYTEYHLVPICTEDQLVPCIEPNCTAMVCGDFKFKPKIAPGFSSPEESSGDVPPDEEESGAMNFYKAQCRFLKMDATLRQVMKNSKSSINVFRVGVGGSFDEFDQYRYYFPMSDQFCTSNPKRKPGENRVDRYINYLGWDSGAGKVIDADPTLIEENCFDEGDVPESFTFEESAAVKTSSIFYAVNYNPVTPDLHNYKFAHYGRLDYWSHFVDDDGGYYRYSSPFIDQFSIYKKIDSEYYRKYLSIAHADKIYGKTADDTTRAPFECNIEGSDCYSGMCNIETYNRGVLLESGYGAGSEPEVVADCNKGADATGHNVVYCAPTQGVATSDGVKPTFDYATANVVTAQIGTQYNYVLDYNSLSQDDEILDPYWDQFQGYLSYMYDGGGKSRTLTNVPSSVGSYITLRKYCTEDFPTVESKENDSIICTHVEQSGNPPPAAGVTFFGLVDESEVIYGGSTIIGYGIASDDTEFENMLVVKNCEMEEGEDYEVVTIDGINDPDFWALRDAFRPYFREKLKGITKNGFNDGCGGLINTVDPVISAMPWVLSYEKGLRDNGFIGDDNYHPISEHVNSVTAQELRERNIYDEPMLAPYSNPGTSSCELRRSTYWWFWSNANFYYNLAIAKKFYLFKYNPGNMTIGKCVVDDSTYLPKVKTFGWCDSCTTSTLAFQSIAAHGRVYMPAYSAKIEQAVGTNIEGICQSTYNSEWELWTGFDISDTVSCFHPRITDIGDYQGSIGLIGSPRTSPEASVMKERMGDYMKSGILPVIDMSDDSNWIIDNPDSQDETNFLGWTINYGSPDNFVEYDFERLLGNMGASVVIVDHVSSKAEAEANVDLIIERSAIVRENCYGCLTAFHVDSPDSNSSFEDIITPIMSHPSGEYNIEMITFDYSPSEHIQSLGGGDWVIENIASYGRVSLRTPGPGRGSPVMIVGFNVHDNDGVWDETNYDEIFGAIVTNQDELVNSGVVGIIYSPARGSGSSNPGLVDVSSGVGLKSEKFCAFQKAMQRMSESPPTAMFSKALVVQNATCEVCTSLDKLPGGSCEPECDNGVKCLLPEGALGDIDTDYKCPVNTVVEDCDLCMDLPGNWECTVKYTNGTEKEINGTMSEMENDLYMDVIGSLEKPIKCCIEDSSGRRYTYFKQSSSSAINKPVVFPRSGDPNVDCGMGDPAAIGELTSFCNLNELPLKDYDLECEVS